MPAVAIGDSTAYCIQSSSDDSAGPGESQCDWLCSRRVRGSLLYQTQAEVHTARTLSSFTPMSCYTKRHQYYQVDSTTGSMAACRASTDTDAEPNSQYTHHAVSV